MAEYLKDVPDAKYGGPTSRNPYEFKYYNANEVVLGKPMKDWLRFAVCWWHTWCGTGFDMFGIGGTYERPWDKVDDSLTCEQKAMTRAKRRVQVHFEFMRKLGVEYFCFHDRDVAPEGKTPAETNANLDEIVNEIEKAMKAGGTKLLWGTANLFSHKRYMNGASTNPDPLVFAHAAAQVKKALEVTHRLGGENYVLWGGREGYANILNTNLRQELDHMAYFLRMVADHKKKIGFKGTLLIEPKPREPTSHQYDFDSSTVMGFLRTYNLQDEYKLNIESNHATLATHTAEHEFSVAAAYGMLGSIDSNHNDASLGWDTDMFPTDVKMATYIMKLVVQQGGLAPGGLNFDCKVRRESTEVGDLFIGHINGMDTFARGLRNCAKIIEEKILDQMLHDRYKDYTETELGKKIQSKSTSLEDLAKYIEAHPEEPSQRSGKEEAFISVFGSYV